MLIPLLCILGAIAIAWWAFTQLTLPAPVRMVAVIVVAIIAIVLLLDMAGGGGFSGFHLSRH